MIDEFTDELAKIEQQIRDLKTINKKASTSLATTAATTTITAQIKGYTFPDGTKTAIPSKAGVIEITMDEPGFVSFTVQTDSGNRRFFCDIRAGDQQKPEAVIQVYRPSLADVQELGGSGTKNINITVRTTCTAPFTVRTYQENI